MDALVLVLFLIGFGLLIGGAELLVRGAARLAEAAGISPLVVGLTVVSYGTSAPELAVTIQSTYAKPPEMDLAIGSVVGSNISNILLVLGLSAMFAPLVVSRQMVRQNVPLMILVAIVLYVLSLDGTLAHWEGILLFVGAIAFTAYMVIESRRKNVPLEAAGEQADRDGGGAKVDEKSAEAVNNDAPAAETSWRARVWTGLGLLALVGFGLLMLLLGARWLVAGAIQFATWLGISKLVIGLTVIAVGTSLPEIATSVIAGLRGHREIAVGNVVGSNLFNILLVIGLTAGVAPSPLVVAEPALWFDMPIMIAASLACLPIFFTGHVISRWEGALFLTYYLAYNLFLFLLNTQHAGLRPFSTTMLWFVGPLTALGLVGLALNAVRRGNPSDSDKSTQ